MENHHRLEDTSEWQEVGNPCKIQKVKFVAVTLSYFPFQKSNPEHLSMNIVERNLHTLHTTQERQSKSQKGNQ